MLITNIGLVVLWHNYRLPVILVVLISFLSIRYLLLRRSKPAKFPHLLKASTPSAESIFTKDTKCPDEESNAGSRYDADITKRASRLLTEAKSTLPRPHLAPKVLTGSKIRKQSSILKPQGSQCTLQTPQIQPIVFFSSLTGSTEKYAKDFVRDLTQSLKSSLCSILDPELHDLSYIDYDDFFVTPPKSAQKHEKLKCFYVLLLPTYNVDTVLNTFLSHLQETHHDFRVDKASLSDLLGYSVFGFGDKDGWPTEEDGFCSQAKEVDKWMAKLTGGKRAFPLGMGDVKSDGGERLNDWRAGVEEVLRVTDARGDLGEGIIGSGEALESDEEEGESADGIQLKLGDTKPSPHKKPGTRLSSNIGDLEDLGRKPITEISPPTSTDEGRTPLAVDFTVSQKHSIDPQLPKEMVPVSSPTHTALTKQGYTIIGSHSGVKICRWTKSALRGRGSCYKYSFYGIKSHLCMETTPSLSCSNKCVFCWRHGTNPVGTTWRWQVDPPDLIFEGAKQGHYKKIKMMRGVPGVRAERFQEAMRIRHCALSLVGEPIFYPHINEFLKLLHSERISSFLVCNAQHPTQLQALNAVTQLYVSIDASNRKSLQKVDRPLHRDFWERFLKCLDIIREKRFKMRTVFRLTLVKGFNVEDEAEGYADLVSRGLPCFVEIKGVTYCGTSSSAGAALTMQNVPFYDEVVAFVETLNAALERRGLQYGIAAEHAHSCCVLIASKRFLVDGRWHTLIDYDKFFVCLESGQEFTPEDYMGSPTPDWATWGNGGFDPADERVHKKGKNKTILGSI